MMQETADDAEVISKGIKRRWSVIRRIVLIGITSALTVGGWSTAGGATLEVREATYYGAYYGAAPLLGVYGTNNCNQAASVQGVCFGGFPSTAKSAMVEVRDRFVTPGRAFVVRQTSTGSRSGVYVCSGRRLDLTGIVWVEVWVDIDGAQNCGYGGAFRGYATTGVVRLHLSDEPVPVYTGGGGW